MEWYLKTLLGGLVIIGIVVLLAGIAFIFGSIALWALNVLGFLMPWTWEKALAVGVLMSVISGIKLKFG